MSRMLRLELVGLVLLACTQILTEHRDFHGPRNQYGYRVSGAIGGDYPGARTREVEIKCGRLRGTVVQPRAGDLPLVDVFRGVPYAQPPVGNHRFEPPSTQSPWPGVRDFVKFAPVCPQVLPNTEEEVEENRHRDLERLLPYLTNQSEDCLYLNIYAPHQNGLRGSLEKYPVMVFIHGESYEWNSGNPYDGSVLAAFGNIVFVTVNFRLGILGFLRPGTKDNTASNFGLLDQIAALVWLKDNIDQFGGDPSRITLLGHGTGAVFVNLLLLSPVEDLFKRAILMSGSALNPDAIGKAPLQMTSQVAFGLNCQNKDEELVNCLKNRTVEDLLHLHGKIEVPRYVPAFAPLVDSAIIPDKPSRLMRNADRLGRFDLMYGVTELEKFHILPGVELLDGLDDARRDNFIRDSVKATHELESDLILRKVLEHYKGAGARRGRRSTEAERKWNRDLALEVASDSGVVAPMIATANLHSRANPKSYMYVFTHLRSIRDKDFNKQIRRTVHGEELPYVLGVPLDGGGYHPNAAYDKGEAFLSKAMMDWWCNFAYSGNPNNVRPPPRRRSYLGNDYKQSEPYEIDWPEYDPENQMYFNLTTPPRIGRRYRAAEMEFWNEAIPRLLRRPKLEPPGTSATSTWSTTDFRTAVYGQDLANGSAVSSNESSSDPANIINKSDEGGGGGALRSSSVVSMVIGFGLVFLLINATLLVYLYHKRQRMRKKASTAGNLLAQTSGRSRSGHQAGSTNGLLQEAAVAATLAKRTKGGKADSRELGYCNSASKPDIRELIKNDKAYDNNSNFGRRSRENSSSTIDTRIKVREWIQQEIVHRCSPRFLRKTRETLQREHREKLMKQGRRGEAVARRLDSGDDEEEAEATEDEGRRRLYDEAGQIRVRPGLRRQQKVSVAVDATPAARTLSVLNQVPIELARIAPDPDEYHGYDDAATVLGTSEYCEPAELGPNETDMDEVKGGANIVVIEHHHSRSDPLPMDKIPSYGASKAISTAARINESDSGSASSLYAKINPKKKTRLPIHHNNQPKLLEQEPAELELHSQPMRVGANGSTTLPRLLTFGGGTLREPAPEVNVTSRDAGTTMALEPSSSSHEEALRTIRRRNYPKVLPDIEKRRSLPPNASFVMGTSTMIRQPSSHRQAHTPPSPPPRLYGTSRSLDCVEDGDEEEEEEDRASVTMPVTTNLHVGPLRKKPDSVKNQSVPSLTDASDSTQLSSATSMPVCPVHGSKQNIPGARSEPRILITPLLDNNHVLKPHPPRRMEEPMSVDQPDCSQRLIPERGTKLPRIIIKPTTSGGTMPRSRSSTAVRTIKPSTPGALPTNLHDNETYQRLLARREKMPLPGELSGTRIPQPLQRVEVIQRVNVTDAAATKL